MELLIAHWHQILFVIGIIVVAVRLESEVKNLLSLRDKARENKNYKEADRIRDELLDKGVLIEDKDGKTLWKFK